MAQLLASYTLNGERHLVELLSLRDRKLLIDRAGDRSPLLVAELSGEEGEEQALAVLEGGGYLERARTGEPGLCRALAEDELLGRPERRRAA